MINNFISFKKKMLNKQIEKLFFYLMWIGIIVSINTNSSLLYLKSYKFFEILNFLRAAAPLVIFIILIIYLLFKIRNFNFFKKNGKINFICVFVLFYSAIQICSLFLNNDQFYFDRIWWNISYLNVLIFLYLGSNLYNDSFIKNLLFIVLFFVFCFYSSIAFITIKESLTLNLKSLYFSPLLGPGTFILDQGLPRTSGVARALFFLFLLNLSLLCFTKSFFLAKLFFSFLLAWLVSLFDSRITSIFFFISLFIVFYSQINLLKKFSILLILITTFVYSQNIYQYITVLQSKTIVTEVKSKKRSQHLASNLLKNYIIKDDETSASEDKKPIDDYESVTNQELSSFEYEEILFFKKPLICDEENFININSSGRLCIWTDNLNTALKNYNVFLIGHGAQADRYNVKYKSTVQELSASNSFLYVLISGGVFSLIFSIIIHIIFLINFLNFFISTGYKFSNISYLFTSCLLINSFILFRGITESSFSVFSLDYILFMVTTFIIFSKNGLNNNKIFNVIKK